MFCGKCGAKNADDAMFCKECGAQLSAVKKDAEETGSVVVTSSQENERNKKVGIIAAVVVVALVAVLAIALFGGRSYKSTVKKYLNASFKADAETIVELIPEEMIDYMLDEYGYDEDEFDEMVEELEEELQDVMDYLGDDVKFSYEIKSAKDVSDDDLSELQEEYEEVDVEVSAAKTVKVKLKIESDDFDESTTMEISVIKVGRSWYLDVYNMGGIF